MCGPSLRGLFKVHKLNLIYDPASVPTGATPPLKPLRISDYLIIKYVRKPARRRRENFELFWCLLGGNAQKVLFFRSCGGPPMKVIISDESRKSKSCRSPLCHASPLGTYPDINSVTQPTASFRRGSHKCLVERNLSSNSRK